MIELPPLPPTLLASKCFPEWGVYLPTAIEYVIEARERTLQARIAELHKDLADCYRLTGADPDDNEDWRLARDAVKEVAAMRTDLDLAEARIAELQAELLAAADVLETCRYSEQPAAKRARDAARKA